LFKKLSTQFYLHAAIPAVPTVYVYIPKVRSIFYSIFEYSQLFYCNQHKTDLKFTFHIRYSTCLSR